MKRRATLPFDPKAFLAKANGGRTISTHRQKTIIFAQGDAADAVFYIKSGKVKVTIVSKEGKEAVVAILGTDEFFGEGILIGQPKRLATASAMTECVIMRVEKAEIMRVIRDEPAFSQMFMSHILTRSARIEEDLVDQLFNSTEKRLARVLLLMANFGKEGRPFRHLGFIEYNGHIEVHSSLLSVVLAEQSRSVQPSP
jgi:CRP/FNR family cyclic AMP-dependent transcriptional regulator